MREAFEEGAGMIGRKLLQKTVVKARDYSSKTSYARNLLWDVRG